MKPISNLDSFVRTPFAQARKAGQPLSKEATARDLKLADQAEKIARLKRARLAAVPVAEAAPPARPKRQRRSAAAKPE